MKKMILFTIGIMLSTSAYTSAQEKASDIKQGRGAVWTEARKARKEQVWDRQLYLGSTMGFGGTWVRDIPGDNSFKAAGKLGVSVITERSKVWAWGGSLVISSEGYRTRIAAGEATVTPVYLRLPLRGYYFFTKGNIRPMLYFGPEVGLKIAEDRNGPRIGNESATAGDAKQFRTFDAGLNAGVGVNIKAGCRMWLNIDGGYYKGFMDAIEKSGGSFNENNNLVGSITVLWAMKK